MSAEPKLAEIIENEGFRHIAYAIRRSTITPQYLKGESMYEVRYGLGTNLKRKAAYRDEFINALTEFLQSYNQENAQKFERTKQQMRENYRENDLDEIVRLVDKFGSEIVCNLLIAYGYARESKEG